MNFAASETNRLPNSGYINLLTRTINNPFNKCYGFLLPRDSQIDYRINYGQYNTALMTCGWADILVLTNKIQETKPPTFLIRNKILKT